MFLLKPGRKKKKKNRGKEIVCQLGSVLALYDIFLWHRLMNKGITHVLIVRSTLEQRLDPKFPTELKYQIVEVRSTDTQKGQVISKSIIPGLWVYFCEFWQWLNILSR